MIRQGYDPRLEHREWCWHVCITMEQHGVASEGMSSYVTTAPGNVFAVIRSAVCAVGYARVPFPEISTLGKRWLFEVIGTGFVYAPNHVVTCAHVIDDLSSAMRRKHIPAARAFVQFVFPLAGGGSFQAVAKNFSLHQRLDKADAAVLSVRTIDLPSAAPAQIAPAGSRYEIGDEIGICGYAHGTSLLRRGGATELFRFGPIAQRGIIAAIAPFDNRQPGTLLLDLRAAPAASGSPVFRLRDGVVIGMLVEGQKGDSASISLATTIVARGYDIEFPMTEFDVATEVTTPAMRRSPQHDAPQ